MTKNILIIFAIFIYKSAICQQSSPTFWYKPNIGDQYYSYPINGEPNPGSGGINQVWDFSKREYNAGYRNKVYVNNTQSSSIFLEIGNPEPTAPSNWLPRKNYKINEDSIILFQIGRYQENLIYTNQQLLFAKNPISYNYTLSDDMQGYLQTDVGKRNFYQGKSVTKVDGVGKLTLPNGLTYDAIRAQIITTLTDSNVTTKLKTTKSYTSYLWFKNGINSYPLLQIEEQIYPLSAGTSFVFNSSFLTSTNIANNVIDLINVYPTQTKENISVQYSLSKLASVTITLKNSLGVEIQKLKPTTILQGEILEEFKLQNLTAGIYFVDINTNGISNVKKIVISE